MNDIETLAALEDIKRCKFQYCFSVDTKDWEAFGSAFAEDAVWDERDFPIARHPVTKEWIKTCDLDLDALNKLSQLIEWPVIGRSAIVAVARESIDSAISFHKLFMPRIDLTSDTTATAIWPMEDIVHYNSGTGMRFLHGMGHYHDEYERIAGRWLIKKVWLSRLWVNVTP